TFFVPMKLAFFVALMLTMPWVLYQLWAFVAPGLYQHEKRFARPLLVAATLLFYAGCAFMYFVMMPVMFAYLGSAAPEGVGRTPGAATGQSRHLAVSAASEAPAGFWHRYAAWSLDWALLGAVIGLLVSPLLLRAWSQLLALYGLVEDWVYQRVVASNGMPSPL